MSQWEEGNIVAWADLCTVRIMNIATQTAICYLSAPVGVGVDLTASPPSVLCPCPCLLFWYELGYVDMLVEFYIVLLHTYIHTYIHIIADIGRMSSIC